MDLSKKKCNAFTFFTSKLRSDEPKIRPWKVRKSSSSLMIMMTFTKNKWISICLCRKYCSSSSSDCFNCNRIAMPFMVPPFFFSKLKSVFYQDEPYIPKCICYIHSPRFRKYFASKDSFLSHLQGHMWKYFYISAWVSLYQNQMVRKTTEKEEEGQIDTKGKKNTVTVAKTKLSSVQAKVS